MTARLDVAGVNYEPVEPGFKALGLTQTGQVTPRPEERLLRGVFGAGCVAQDPIREGVTAVGVLRGELRKRFAVASLSAFDEPDRHRFPREERTWCPLC